LGIGDSRKHFNGGVILTMGRQTGRKYNFTYIDRRKKSSIQNNPIDMHQCEQGQKKNMAF